MFLNKLNPAKTRQCCLNVGPRRRRWSIIKKTGSFRVKSNNIWEIEKVHVSEIHQILTIHSPGTWNMFSKKNKQFHNNGGYNAPLYTWGRGVGKQKYATKITVVF